mgnify:FL=1
MANRFYPYISALFLLLLCSCAPQLNTIAPADLQQISQDPRDVIRSVESDQPLLGPDEQRQFWDNFRDTYFLPWHSTAPLPTTAHPFWAIDWITRNTVYDKTLRPLQQQRNALIQRAGQQSFPTEHRRAITVVSCSVRALPTSAPLFYNPQQAGQGFPFDQLQHAMLPANTPVQVSHRSADGAWLFVETAAIYGWVASNAVAWVDSEQIARIESAPLAAVIRDQVAILGPVDQWYGDGRIGMLLPLASPEPSSHRVLMAVAGPDQQAQFTEATLAEDALLRAPLPLSPHNIARLAAPMMGQRYDWGEQFGGRDCSATLRDLFAPFGVWLPRNSSQQAEVGHVIPLSDLSPKQREQLILEQGIPFATFISLPGHIMLYVGQHDGHAIVLHTLWGLKTTSLFGKEGRWLVGKTVLTTLQPGLEQDGLWQSIGDLRSRITQMSLPLQPAQSE